jgi:hypothetical protein
MIPMSEPGQEFVQALAAKDADRLRRVLAPDVDLKGMTPGAQWEADTAESAIKDVFFQWFEEQDHIEEILTVHTGEVVDRPRITYRFLVRTPDGPHEVEQQMYYEM